MKMTDAKRENLFSYDQVDDEKDGEVYGEELCEEEEDLSDDEDLSLWGQSALQKVFAKQAQVQQKLGTLLRAGVKFPQNVVKAVSTPQTRNANVINAPSVVRPSCEGSDEEEEIQVTRSEPTPASPVKHVVG